MKLKPYISSFPAKSFPPKPPAGRESEFLDCTWGVNSLGVSEKVLQAAREYDWPEVWWHPDPSYQDLKEKIIEFWAGYADIQLSQIQINHGSLEILGRVNRLFLESGSKVLGYWPQFPSYALDAWVCGAKCDAIILRPEENFKFHVERMLEKINPGYSLIYIDNPNNPTGQLITLDDLEAIVREAKNKGVAVIIDEAYGDYVDRSESAVSLISEYNNLIITRTFSKGYGLCSLRIGYGILPMELVSYYVNITPSIRCTTISAYLARVALSDQGFIASCRQRVKAEKGKLIKGLKERGYLIGETHEYCPIFLAGRKNKELDLSQELMDKRILTESGTRYKCLNNNYVRINCPAYADDFLSRL